MFCYNCGCHLSEHDFCTSCGADVSLYTVFTTMDWRKREYGILRVRSTAYGRA